ncbi:MAG: hypothetical protein II949_15170 [Prevotella sp.]|nr:hypothetical protein [Prevotella sp.]
MNRITLFRLLRRNNKLGVRRNPAFEQSVVAKVLMYIGAGMMCLYLIMFAVIFSGLANDEAEPAMWLVIMPLLMCIDFGLRFVVQQTPLMLVKPYMLLPLPVHSVIETFLLTSLLSGYNWTWLCFFVPYCFIVLCGCATFGATLVVLISGIFIVMANSQWFLLVRTLTRRSLFWWLLPLAVYAVYFVPLFAMKDANNTPFDNAMDAFVAFGSTWWFVLVCAAVLVALLMLNRWMQFRYVYDEISREERREGAMKRVAQFTFLERYGQTGEYLKLELKSILRNKAVRARVLMSLGLIVMLTLLIAYTDMYDGKMMLNFWCYYCFAIYGMTALVKVMGPEGNYIDLLMVHEENILSLLKAKYYFHVCILVVPLLLMLPAVIAGKFSILMMAAYMLLSSGVLYCVLFQLAVYNKQTIPLNAKITGKNNVENGFQLLIEMLAMFAPLVLVAVMILLFEESTAYIVLAILGLLFTLAHPLWLRNVYRRMMKRKYTNLEGFHATRS